MVKCEYQFVKGKSSKGKDFEALKFIIKTPVGNYESCLCWPTPLECALIKQYAFDDTNSFDGIYTKGDTSPDLEGF